MRTSILALLLSSISFVSSQAAETAAPDTVNKKDDKTKDLKEVVVEGKSRFLTREGETYRPTSKMKNAATDGFSLINLMGIPSITADPVSDEIKTISGDGVKTFIDYRPATNEEVRQLRTQDVSKVEVLDFPSDPRFQGARHAVNFILVKYEYGGYTKLMAGQFFEYNFGRYSINSKFVFKKMTYDLAVGTNYLNTRVKKTETLSNYRFGDTEAKREETPNSSHNKNNKTFITLSTLYSKENVNIKNTFGINFGPYTHNNAGYDILTDFGFQTEETSLSRNDSHSISPTWNGNYQFFFPNSMSLVIEPSASFMHSGSGYSYEQTSLQPVVNDIDENAWDASLYARFDKQWKNHSAFISASGATTHDKLDYTGTTPAHISMINTSASVMPGVFLNFGKLQLDASLNLQYDWNRYDSEKVNNFYPKHNVHASYFINGKNKIQLSSYMETWTVPMSKQSPNTILLNRLDAISGNEHLKAFNVTTTSLNYSFFPTNNFSASAFCNYVYYDKPIVNVYSPNEIGGNQVMVRRLENLGHANIVRYGLAATYSVNTGSGGRLFIRGQFSGDFSSYHATTNTHHNYLDFNILANYFIKNFFVQAMYTSGSRNAFADGYSISPHSYFIMAGWSHKAFSVNVNATNFLSSGRNYIKTFTDTPHFSQRKFDNTGLNSRYFSLTLSYSFSYGKKVNRTPDLNALKGVESGALK